MFPSPDLGFEVDTISLLPLFFSVGSKDWIQVLMFATEVLLSNELSLAPPPKGPGLNF